MDGWKNLSSGPDIAVNLLCDLRPFSLLLYL